MALKTVKLEAGAVQPELTPAAKLDEASAPPARPDLRTKIIPIAGGVALLAVLWMGGNWLVTGRFEIKTDNAYVRSDITRVTP